MSAKSVSVQNQAGNYTLNTSDEVVKDVARELGSTDASKGGVKNNADGASAAVSTGYAEYKAMGGQGNYSDYTKQVSKLVGKPSKAASSALLPEHEPNSTTVDNAVRSTSNGGTLLVDDRNPSNPHIDASNSSGIWSNSTAS